MRVRGGVRVKEPALPHTRHRMGAMAPFALRGNAMAIQQRHAKR